MKPLNQWMAEYAVTHTHPLNKKIHMFCVPAIYWSITAVVPPYLFIPVLIFYFFLGFQAFITMTVFTAFCLAVDNAILRAGVPLTYLAILIFTVAWFGQFYGHHVEGKRPAFFQDLLFLLIGPLWVARKLKVV
jgi:uncharacterized membrane protein YGL010W